MTFNQDIQITTKFLRMMMTETTRAKKLVKLLERLIKQDHLYTDDKIKEMRAQLRAVKEEISQLEAQTFKGFGKK
jgi:hypothetical protein